MNKQGHPTAARSQDDLDAALDTMSASDLRKVIDGLLIVLDATTRSRITSAIINLASHGGSGWAPAAPDNDDVSEAIAFAEAALRLRCADPRDVDHHLQRGSAAFFRRDYAGAQKIFGAVLLSIGDGQVDLGQDEMVDEVLGTNVSECAAQYVVSAYMLSDGTERANAVRAAMDEVHSVERFREPIQKLERVAVEPLVELDDFLRHWKDLIERQSAAGVRNGRWDRDYDHWLREVVYRLDGLNGLAQIAKSTRKIEDLRAWCRTVEVGDWKAAFAVFEEAAGLATDNSARAELLDGVALAAQELKLNDLPTYLERAWRAGPSMVRLRRWLGCVNNQASLQQRAAAALSAYSAHAHRQRALLFVLRSDFEAAAELLAMAPGRGWSGGDHVGSLLIPLFANLFGAKWNPQFEGGASLEELMLRSTHGEQPTLAIPKVEQLISTASIQLVLKSQAATAVIVAMQTAAERRLSAVINEKRRSRYGHAAELVAVCAACDPSPQMTSWVAKLRNEHTRLPALRREFDRVLGAPHR